MFEQVYTVGAGETDPSGRCRPSALQGFLQDAATRHAEFLQVSREMLLDKYGLFWVLLRNWYTLTRPVVYGDSVVVRTWHRGAHGAQLYRDFDIEVNGVRVGEATTAWVVLDWKTRRMTRPSLLAELDATKSHDRAKAITLGKLTPPHRLTPVEDRQALYSDLDINEHVNNVRYTDFICDALHMEAHREQFLSSLQVCFLSQVVCGEVLQMFTGEYSDGKYYVTGRDEAGQNRFEAVASLSAEQS